MVSCCPWGEMMHSQNLMLVVPTHSKAIIAEIMVLCRYILVYPQGCDVCNHLSLFLCVADYDKLLPGARPSLFPILQLFHSTYILRRRNTLLGQEAVIKRSGRAKAVYSAGWSHFAQFTIAVVNKDPKKSKYSGECPGLLSPSLAWYPALKAAVLGSSTAPLCYRGSCL